MSLVPASLQRPGIRTIWRLFSCPLPHSAGKEAPPGSGASEPPQPHFPHLSSGGLRSEMGQQPGYLSSHGSDLVQGMARCGPVGKPDGLSWETAELGCLLGCPGRTQDSHSSSPPDQTPPTKLEGSLGVRELRVQPGLGWGVSTHESSSCLPLHLAALIKLPECSSQDGSGQSLGSPLS